MTALALDNSVTSELKNDKVFLNCRPISPSQSGESDDSQRFNLRKRPCSSNSKAEITITAVNSAFLSGLFADVAAAQGAAEESMEPPASQQTADISDAYPEAIQPTKKARIGLNKSMSRCNKSFRLFDTFHCVSSPTDINTAFFDDSEDTSIEKVDSLNFQLKCVSDPVDADNSTPATQDAATLVFPHLPNTISNSSCATSLTRNISDLQSSVAEANSENESSYGWFVEMDEEHDRPTADPYANSGSSLLAFTASTAPKASNYDAELEWAQAADTVDDVLGDFF